MPDSSHPFRPPQKILLATDLDGRTDRALDRAAQLACQWQATLHVLHVMRPWSPHSLWPVASDEEWSREADAELVERRIRQDLREEPEDLVIHVEVGEPANVIEQVATREGCALVVAGSRGTAFSGVPISSTTARLMRRAPQSLLIVKARPRGPYRKLLVGTDYTQEAKCGLETAAGWFADADLAVMHALDIPYRSLLMDGGRDVAISRMEQDAMAAFLDSARLAAQQRERIHTHVEFGHPESMLHDHGLANEVDLVVVGAVTRNLAFHVLVGGNGMRIMQGMPGDVLMVRAPGASQPGSSAAL